MLRLILGVVAALAVWGAAAPPLTPEEKAMAGQLRQMRAVPDGQRGQATRQMAGRIGQLPAGAGKVNLAYQLASLATEGDFGSDTLNQVAAVLAAALAETPAPDEQGKVAGPYRALAQLARYEGVPVTLDAPAYREAAKQLEAEDQRRAVAGFRLPDLEGRQWDLRALGGKVVLLNFWATWCPPCRKELPDMQALYNRFSAQGLVILAISDEEAATVKRFAASAKLSFPVLLDRERKVHEEFGVEGIPKSFVYNRDGKLVATAIDMRTGRQLRAMLAKAGLR
ncbi:MAG: TlpA family protein disulfide reductase [Bryobacterales bacterium]|nr:TlpA family protein disulfide reductase [Bryobacterales bacterium]